MHKCPLPENSTPAVIDALLGGTPGRGTSASWRTQLERLVVLSDGGAIDRRSLRFDGGPRYSLRAATGSKASANGSVRWFATWCGAGRQTPSRRASWLFHPCLVDGLERELIEK